MGKVKTNFKIRRPIFIRQWRKKAGLTIAQLAERLEVSTSNVSQLELGDINYTQPMLEAIANELGCSPADLLMRDPTQTEAPWSIWQEAKPGERKQIIQMMKVITGKTGTEG